jgi:hypothetical protein
VHRRKPLADDYKCSFKLAQKWNLYDNHPGISKEMDNVCDKLAKEEAQSFHVALP